MNIQNISNALSRPLHRGLLVTKKHSPQILTAVGVVGVVATAVLASRATLKVEPVLNKIDEGLLIARRNRETHTYSEGDYRKDVVYVYATGSFDLIKLYSPAITAGGLTIACMISSSNILQRRNVALVAAYKAVEEGFARYRERVVAELGEDKDRAFRYGLVETDVHDTKSGKVTKALVISDPTQLSVYARFFDEFSINHTRDPEYNLVFLKCQQQFANDMLRARGHVFLNEVYDSLGIERSSAGQVVGWVLNKGGDNFIDFGIYSDNERARAFVAGLETSILLDFNVDGVVLDLIEN